MASCRRCGAFFDAKKTDGVCPKCCYYNRDRLQEWEDNSWMKNYNVDDNSYIPPKVSWQDESEVKKSRNRKGQKKGCDIEGSHVHTSRQTKSVKKPQKQDRDKLKKTRKRRLLFVILFYFIFSFLLSGGDTLRRWYYAGKYWLQFQLPKVMENMPWQSEKDEAKKSDKEENKISFYEAPIEELQDGVTVGNTLFHIGEYKLLDAPDNSEIVPPGEKILMVEILSDDIVNMNAMPYIADDYDYREMVHSFEFEKDTEFINYLKEQFPEKEFTDFRFDKGYKIFFLNGDVESVRLCFPEVKVLENKQPSLQEVSYVVLPLK